MSKILVNLQVHPQEKVFSGDPLLSISEIFSETLQGEGVYTGCPATFIRLSGCHLGCSFCDSSAIWRKGQTFTINEVLDILEKGSVIERFKGGEHLVITGGAPLLQEDRLLLFFRMFIGRFGFLPFVQIENECSIQPSPELIQYISCWNNSPKLSNSNVELHKRYRPIVIKKVGFLENSWFKFVVSCQEDWEYLSYLGHYLHHNPMKVKNS